MIGNLDTVILQQIWWILASVVGSLFLFLTFVQGGQTLLWQMSEVTATEPVKDERPFVVTEANCRCHLQVRVGADSL